MSKYRLTITLCSALLLAATTSAQPPEAIAPPTSSIMEGSAAPIFGESIANDNGSFWFRADYLVSWIQGPNLPPLVTTSPTGTARAAAGVLDVPGTTTLFGGTVAESFRSGFRIEGGWAPDSERRLALEAGFFMLESQSAIFSASSANGIDILARPFRNNATNGNSAALIAFPGLSTGSIDIRAHTGNLFEGHLDIAERSIDAGWYRLFSLVGYRVYRYDEDLRIQQNFAPGVPFIPGTQIAATDQFTTRNEFHGLDLGFRSQFVWQVLTLDVTTKFAIGRLYREVNIDGIQTVTAPGTATVTNPGNLLATTSNIGNRTSADWKAMPEIGAGLSWQMGPNVRLRVGYTTLLLNGVARAGDQIDTVINTNFLPPAIPAAGGPARPTFNLTRTDVWVQNINVGFEFVY